MNNTKKKYLFLHTCNPLPWVALALMLSTGSLSAQENITTFGLQYKPIISSKFFDTGEVSATNEDMTVLFTPRFGMNLGMIIRRGLSKNWSFETGINLVQRNYTLNFQHPELNENQTLRFRLIGYEIPLQGLVYVRLGGQLWMNASGGLSLDLYPSDVSSSGFLYQDSTIFDYSQFTVKNSWIQFSLLANYGFEWRTKDKGYFYLGASFHRPFSNIALTEATLEINTDPTRVIYALNGSYLTADFRYFFHEKAEKRKKIRNR